MGNLVKCSICGDSYSYCPNCANTHAWKFYTDTYECYQIFMIIKQYGAKQIDKNEAKAMLEHISITTDTDLSKYKPKIAEKIKNILAEPEKPVIKKSKRSKLFDEE